MKKILLLITLLCLLCASACNLGGETVTTDTDANSDVIGTDESEGTTAEITTAATTTAAETTDAESVEPAVTTTAASPETTEPETETTTATETTTEPETTADSKNDYTVKYSPVTFSSGGQSINPIQCFLGYAVADGLGVQEIFQNKDFDQSLFPTLILNGELTVEAPEDYEVSERIDVYDKYYKLIHELTSLDEVSALNDGEYLLVFAESISNYGDNPDPNVKYENQLVFRLVVPAEPKYGSVTLSAGENQIKPLAFMIFHDEYVDGENFFCADGWGANRFFEHPLVYQSCLPTLQIEDGLSISYPSGTTSTTTGCVYDMDCNEVCAFEELDELSALESGEYIINITELVNTCTDENDGDYSIIYNDLIFKLIVP